jgi:hypothetical protein
MSIIICMLQMNPIKQAHYTVYYKQLLQVTQLYTLYTSYYVSYINM